MGIRNDNFWVLSEIKCTKTHTLTDNCMHKRTVRGDREYTIYTKDEASEKGIDWVHWKDAQPGDWAITDDGYVSECRKRYNTKGSDQVLLAAGMQWVTKTATLEFEPHLEHNSFSLVKPQSFMEKEAKATRTKVAMMRVASEIVSGTPFSKIDWYDIGAQMRPDMVKNGKTTDQIIGWAKKTFKSKEIMNEVQKKVIQLLNEGGFSDEEITNYYKLGVELAVFDKDSETGELTLKEDPDLTNFRHFLKAVTEMKGTDKPRSDGTGKVVDEMNFDFSRQITEGAEVQKKQLSAKRTHMLDSHDDEDDDQD